MRGDKKKELISILMESSLYITLSVRERHSLLIRLEESYPILRDGDVKESGLEHVPYHRFRGHL
jgi:hypothetical protein